MKRRNVIGAILGSGIGTGWWLSEEPRVSDLKLTDIGIQKSTDEDSISAWAKLQNTSRHAADFQKFQFAIFDAENVRLTDWQPTVNKTIRPGSTGYFEVTWTEGKWSPDSSPALLENAVYCRVKPAMAPLYTARSLGPKDIGESFTGTGVSSVDW